MFMLKNEKGIAAIKGISHFTSLTEISDLGFQVVDMFGCGLPVCAVSYSW